MVSVSWPCVSRQALLISGTSISWWNVSSASVSTTPGSLDRCGVERGCWWWVLLGTLLGPEGSDRLVWLLGGLLFPYTVSLWGWVWGVGWCRLFFENNKVEASIDRKNVV